MTKTSRRIFVEEAIMLQIYPIPAFENNYFWLIRPDSQSTAAYIVDPGAAAPVQEALINYGLELNGILITQRQTPNKLQGLKPTTNKCPRGIKTPEASRKTWCGLWL